MENICNKESNRMFYKALPVISAMLEAIFSANPILVFIPVPTAVPPC